MAEIVAVHAASHTPVMLNFPDAISSADRDEIFATFRQLGQQIRDAAPQAVVVISDDHLTVAHHDFNWVRCRRKLGRIFEQIVNHPQQLARLAHDRRGC